MTCLASYEGAGPMPCLLGKDKYWKKEWNCIALPFFIIFGHRSRMLLCEVGSHDKWEGIRIRLSFPLVEGQNTHKGQSCISSNVEKRQDH